MRGRGVRIIQAAAGVEVERALELAEQVEGRRGRNIGAAAEEGRPAQVAADDRVADDVGTRGHIPGRDQVEAGQDLPGRHRAGPRGPGRDRSHHDKRRRYAQRPHGIRHFRQSPQHAAARDGSAQARRPYANAALHHQEFRPIFFWKPSCKDSVMLRRTFPRWRPDSATARVRRLPAEEFSCWGRGLGQFRRQAPQAPHPCPMAARLGLLPHHRACARSRGKAGEDNLPSGSTGKTTDPAQREARAPHEDRNLQRQWRQRPACRSSALAQGDLARCRLPSGAEIGDVSARRAPRGGLSRRSGAVRKAGTGSRFSPAARR